MASIGSDYTAGGVFHGEPCQAPGKCARPTAAGDVCSWGCQNAFTPIRDALGCCYETMRAYSTALNYDVVGRVFANTDLVTSECDRPPGPQCDVFRQWAESAAELVIEVPCHFARAQPNGGEFHQAATRGLQRATGVPSKGLVIFQFSYNTAATTRVHVRLLDQGSAQAAARVAALNARAAAGETVSFHSERMYFSSAQHRDWTAAAKSNYYAEF